jgi:hypothetical protein
MKTRWWIAGGLAVVTTLVVVAVASAVSGAAFTTYNAHVDGNGKDVCKNSAIDCNIYGAKEFVWLNGGPAANGLGPDGQYFFAVLAPGGQPNPNDGGAKNLSDDYDCYLNRLFTVTGGEVSAYAGHACGGSYPFQTRHWLDNGVNGPKPNWQPPYIRLFPYADTPNPGGVYIMAICSLQDGYPVEPRFCKYDAFKVKKGRLPYSFMLSGIKFQDTYADGVKDAASIDPGLPVWSVDILGTGPNGLPIDQTVTTDSAGYWEWLSPEYIFTGGTQPGPVHLEICEELQPGWTQSYPAAFCHTLDFTPTAASFDSFENLDFGNWQPVSVTACKAQELDDGSIVSVAGWLVSLTKEGVVQDTSPTGEDGCYTWANLDPGPHYDVHEADKSGWMHLGPIDYVFDRAGSGDTLGHTFVNAILEGCTPGFWQGGSDSGTAGGRWLWNESDDPQWPLSGGQGTNPYIWTTPFNSFFTPYADLDGFDMMSLVGTGGGPDDFQKAARDLVAAYLNSSWGMNYPYSPAQLSAMWTDAVNNEDFMPLHLLLDAANNAYDRTDGGPACPISASGY